jgi:hypothetical protein
MATIEIPKKRGRRKKIVPEIEVKTTKKSKKCTDLKDIENTITFTMKNANIIMDLKCCIADIDKYITEQKWKTDNLTYDPNVPTDFIPYDANNEQLDLLMINDKPPDKKVPDMSGFMCKICDSKQHHSSLTPDEFTVEDSHKLKELKLSFYKNEIPNKKVDCFWCTYPYDNDPFHILQYGSNGDFLAHGSFCSPECGVAFLFKNMKWDDSAKMESYQLMNYFYSSTNNIKPAATPFYFLEKYYGNMTIQEFRKMSKTSHVMMCIDKPVTRILPEIHEDNEKFISTGTTSSQSRGNYKVKKQSEKTMGLNRNDILRDNFRGGVSVQ